MALTEQLGDYPDRENTEFHELVAALGNHYVQIGENAHLEELWFAYQVGRRTSDPSMPNLAPISALNEYEGRQVGNLVETVHAATGTDKETLGRRLSRIGLLYQEKCQQDGEDVGGSFNRQTGI